LQEIQETLNFRYFIRLSFNGESFHGWQRQHNAHTLQAALKDALCVVLRQPAEVTGAGRTDAGVHAREFFAHFDLAEELSPGDRKELVHHLNGYLPGAITIHAIFPVSPGAHARFSALSRTYQYFIAQKKDPFLAAFSYYYPGKLNIRLMNQGAGMIKETLDFTSFAKLPAETKTNICHVVNAVWEEKDHMLIFTITADRFLRNMVRAVVGTLIELGRGKIRLEDIQRIIDSHDRCAAGYSVPANGLFLVSVKYPDEIFLESADDPIYSDGDSENPSGEAEPEKKT
jgi:tRNA pseudouridine38-40 synthase